MTKVWILTLFALLIGSITFINSGSRAFEEIEIGDSQEVFFNKVKDGFLPNGNIGLPKGYRFYSWNKQTGYTLSVKPPFIVKKYDSLISYIVIIKDKKVLKKYKSFEEYDNDRDKLLKTSSAN